MSMVGPNDGGTVRSTFGGVTSLPSWELSYTVQQPLVNKLVQNFWAMPISHIGPDTQPDGVLTPKKKAGRKPSRDQSDRSGVARENFTRWWWWI